MSTPLHSWSLLFSDGIFEIILRYTNEDTETEKNSIEQKQTYHTNVDAVQRKALFDLLYFDGVEKHNHTNFYDMWATRFGRNVYRSVMSERFKFLCTCLRFDDKNTKADRRAIHIMAPIKEIRNIFIGNRQKYYSPSTNCTLDEQLLGFRG